MKARVTQIIIFASVCLVAIKADAGALPYGLKMGMTLKEVSQWVSLAPVEGAPNLYQTGRLPNGPKDFTFSQMFITPKHGLCKISTTRDPIYVSQRWRKGQIFDPWVAELTKEFGAGTEVEAARSRRQEMTLWFLKDSPTQVSAASLTMGDGGSDDSNSWLIISHEWQSMKSCVEEAKAYADPAQWMDEGKRYLAEIGFTSDPKALSQEKHPNFPKKYKGDDIERLISQFEKIDEEAKDEFTKKSEIEKKVAGLRGGKYLFTFDKSDNPNFLEKYDAESETLSISMAGSSHEFILNQNHSSLLYDSPSYYVINLASKLLESSYVGQNAFGATAKIRRTSLRSMGVALNNWPRGELLSLSLSLPPKEAKALKADLAYFIEIQLVDSNVIKGNVLVDAHAGEKPTVANPEERSWSNNALLSNVTKAGVYRKSTGEVLGWKQYLD